ncbi:hypothetical protein GCM10023093_11770 [Nemorincola caseinilytica]|uniref:Protein glutaminase domain-containing protein n=2 Tax=Nemorincola caseinilytica TaxID=2054315 RepID=A0ABP8NC56_9BACT
MVLLSDSCIKKDNPILQRGAKCSSGPHTDENNTATSLATTGEAMPAGGYHTLSSKVTVAGIRNIEGSASVEVMFNENTEFFTVTGTTLVQTVKDALKNNRQLSISFDPWKGVLVSAAYVPVSGGLSTTARTTVNGAAGARAIDLKKVSNEQIDNPSAMGVLNTTDPGLNNVIPDFTTAQLMFDYITRQCCYLPGPYAIDYCIPFQYCIDGCYARAHKMCWIINNRYKYGTKKIFSFANSGSDKLCVQGQKWGGCCIRWWYHVAPLVTVQTPTGPKAYVFDPAMFNQPVLLSTWLHAQENPACAAGFTPNVTMINVQPTSSYAPSGSSGMTFSTDPAYTATNNTLDNYAALITCP